MEEKKIKALCNVCVLIILAGFVRCAFANDSQDVYSSFLLIAIGAVGAIIFGHVLEKIRPLPLKDWSREDFEEAEYMYQGEYPFFLYMMDNGSSVKELVEILDDTPDSEMLLNMLYIDYEKTAGEAITQTLEQVKATIERERRKCNGRIEFIGRNPKGA